MKFINREKDITYLNSHFESEPNSLLFIYGPKSSGKSTLLENVVKKLDTSRYAVNFLDLRRVIIYDFKTFLNVFFPKRLRGKFKDIISGVTFNTGFFSIKVEEEAALTENSFAIIAEKLESAKKRNIQPIIIIDEIQLLKHIYIDRERYLIDELFNLFIALTKVTHLAHIILATSDSYFIEEIYNSAKLEKTSEFYLIDHFNKEEVYNWLRKEQFSDEEIETVWHYIGGCPWEITQIIEKRKQGKKVKQLCLDFIDNQYGKISNYRFKIVEKDLKAEFDRIIRAIVKDGYYKRNDNENTVLVESLLKRCIEIDMWFYIVNKHHIIANSKSIFYAFKKMADSAKHSE